MKVTPTELPEVCVVRVPRWGDARGWFMETWREDRASAAGIVERFVQDNASFSATVGTIRGLHFQVAPAAQGKLVRVVRGAIWDVAVDIRPASPAFGRWVGVRLDAAEGAQLWVPAGFAHGFCTLEPDTEVAYKVTALYAPEHERGLAWDDPDLAIPWPLPPGGPTLSDRDRLHPPLAALRAPQERT
jgi:dTDP-4-dehydrorhamnose 3,5-epimerase